MKIFGQLGNKQKLFLAILMIASALFTSPVVIHRAAAWDNGDGGGSSLTQTPATFSNYELAGNEFIAGHSQGVSCPNTATVESGKCYSTQGEPAIRADKSGNFYGSSESTFCVIGGQCGGTFAWKSTDGGSHFTTLSLPNTVTIPTTGIGASLEGSDTDIAVAPVKNTNGFYNIYVGSLHKSLQAIGVSTSTDGGNTWLDNSQASRAPVVDREWLAADGANKICVSYHALSLTEDIRVDCSTNAGLAFTTTTSAFDALHAPIFLALNNKIGTLTVDPHTHIFYQAFSSVADTSEIAPCATGCNFHTVWIGVSLDGGNTFKDYIVYDDKTHQSDFGHSFVQISVDNGGNLYAAYSDDHNMFYSFSRNFGQSWTGPFQVNKAPANTAIFPWSAAGNVGQLDIVYYGTSWTNGSQVPTNFPPYPSTLATWYVYFAQNLNALTPNSRFTQVAASGVVHYGDVCELGASCASNQNRDLLDDFGVAASPTTGNAAIIYTSDQYVNSALEPAMTFGSRHCSSTPPGQPTSPAENTVDCNHTDIAVQTGGSTVNNKPPHHDFEVDDEDFEELNLSNDGGHSPHNEIDISNIGTVPIDKLDIGIGGQGWQVNWNTASPVQPGQTVVGTSTGVPLGLLLAVGTVYQVTVTATLADGTTETQTGNVIYTLGAGIGL